MHSTESKPGFPDRPPQRHLRAGPLELILEEGDLRYVRLGEQELVRRIYGAVRDANWGTVPGLLSNVVLQESADSFSLTYTCTHRQGGIHWVWEAEITGSASGEIRFVFAGEARSTFRRNRIGLCVLHPAAFAGREVGVIRQDGSSGRIRFPDLIEPQQPVPGWENLRGLSWEVSPGVEAELEFSGDEFETEDQRNWIDASFKTFSTPLRLPFPVEVSAGTRVRQEVTLRLKGSSAPTPRPELSQWVEITVGTDRHRLPSLGLMVATPVQPLTGRELSHLETLWLWHLRVDVRLAEPAWPVVLALAVEQAALLATPLELAVHLPRQGDAEALRALAARLGRSKCDVARILAFREGERTTSPEVSERIREHLGFLEVPIGAGTDGDFCQLNQNRPEAPMEFVHWSMNPQVHATDLTSILETPEAIPAQIRTAQTLYPEVPVVVSPVTLKQRFNPVATTTESGTIPDALPASVDPRQGSILTAGWTLAVVKALAESGVESVTLLETVGWRGVVEREQGSAWPEGTDAEPGQVFPVYHVLGWLTAFGNGEVVASRSSDPRRVESLVLSRKGQVCVLLFNLTPEPQTVRLRGLPALTHQNSVPWDSPAWKFQPETILRGAGRRLDPVSGDAREVQLEPYGFHQLQGGL